MDYEKKYNEALEQAAKEYCQDDAYPFGPDIINKEVRKAFIAGYNLCKEQMMKDAVAVEVVGDKRDLRLIDSTKRCLFNAKRGDWLKIIIVKEG